MSTPRKGVGGGGGLHFNRVCPVVEAGEECSETGGKGHL